MILFSWLSLVLTPTAFRLIFVAVFLLVEPAWLTKLLLGALGLPAFAILNMLLFDTYLDKKGRQEIVDRLQQYVDRAVVNPTNALLQATSCARAAVRREREPLMKQLHVHHVVLDIIVLGAP